MIEREDGVNGMEERPQEDDAGEPIGPFPTWKALYATVITFHVLVIILLYVFTVTLGRGAP